MKFTEDKELRDEIIKQLQENKKKYGKSYCPCVNPQFYNEDSICPCKDFRENVSIGKECHCGLWIKEEKDFIGGTK